MTAVSSATKPRRLKRITVTEVSLVDAPANPHARVLIAKRDGAAPGDGHSLVRNARERAERSRKAHADPFAAGKVPVAKAADPRAGARAVLRKAMGEAGFDPASPLSPVAKRGGESPVKVAVPISRTAADRRYVAGWANVIEVGGVPVVDAQGHSIGLEELEAAAHGFMRDCREGRVMHGPAPAFEVTESVVVTPAVAAAMGMSTDRTGWWIGGFVKDDDAWRRVKAGELRALSIGGTATVEG